MAPVSTAAKADQVDYVASNLLARATLLVRLLLKQVPSRQLTRTEAEVLQSLRDGPRRITELADLGCVAQPTMTLLVKRLEDNGWVARERLPEDGRVAMISITDAGLELADAYRAAFMAALRSDLGELSDEQLAALSSATETLGALTDALQQRDVR
jgi:DNA-binding MarR family transcriptional regulator